MLSVTAIEPWLSNSHQWERNRSSTGEAPQEPDTICDVFLSVLTKQQQELRWILSFFDTIFDVLYLPGLLKLCQLLCIESFCDINLSINNSFQIRATPIKQLIVRITLCWHSLCKVESSVSPWLDLAMGKDDKHEHNVKKNAAKKLNHQSLQSWQVLEMNRGCFRAWGRGGRNRSFKRNVWNIFDCLKIFSK